MSTISYKGYNVWYRESGEGDPIVFLHNGGNDHRIWDHQVAHFSRTHRVIVVDHLGHGQSDSPSIDYTLPLFTGQVEALVDQLKLEPVTLVGHCIGAAMALNYTIAHPAKVRALVLFNVATEKNLLAGPLADIYRNFSNDPDAREAFIQAIESGGLPRDQKPACKANLARPMLPTIRNSPLTCTPSTTGRGRCELSTITFRNSPRFARWMNSRGPQISRPCVCSGVGPTRSCHVKPEKSSVNGSGQISVGFSRIAGISPCVSGPLRSIVQSISSSRRFHAKR